MMVLHLFKRALLRYGMVVIGGAHDVEGIGISVLFRDSLPGFKDKLLIPFPK